MENSSDQLNKSHLIKNFKVAVTDAEELLKATANTGGEKLAEVRTKVEESLNVVKARLAEAQDEALLRAKLVAKATDVYVHNNPWRSISLAAGIGVVVGLFVGRR